MYVCMYVCILWAITKQACRDRSVIFLLKIFFTLYFMYWALFYGDIEPQTLCMYVCMYVRTAESWFFLTHKGNNNWFKQSGKELGGGFYAGRLGHHINPFLCGWTESKIFQIVIQFRNCQHSCIVHPSLCEKKEKSSKIRKLCLTNELGVKVCTYQQDHIEGQLN